MANALINAMATWWQALVVVYVVSTTVVLAIMWSGIRSRARNKDL